jgi:AcrR family transcriptional regulator
MVLWYFCRAPSLPFRLRNPVTDTTAEARMGNTRSKQSVREAILDAADRLLSHYGYRKMTMDDLAVAAGIGKGTIYLHFPSKQDVALSWIDRLIERLLERLREIAGAGRAPDETIREMLQTRVLFLFDTAQRHTHILDEMFGALRPAYMERRRQYLAREAALFAEVLRGGQQRGVFRPGDPVPMARALVLATNALMPFSLSTEELGRREEVARNAEMIAELLLTGLHRRG